MSCSIFTNVGGSLSENNLNQSIFAERRYEDFKKYAAEQEDILALFVYRSFSRSKLPFGVDVDIAVFPLHRNRWSISREIEILSELIQIWGGEDISLTNLESVSVILQMRILDTGRLLYCINKKRLAEFIERVMHRYCDFFPDFKIFYLKHENGHREENNLQIDKELIRHKIRVIRSMLKELHRLRSLDDEILASDFIYGAAATRMLQVAIEAFLDICAHVIARAEWGLPKSYEEMVEIICKQGLIPGEKEEDFRLLAHFRNRAVHIDELSTEEVYDIIRQRLELFSFFTSSIHNFIEK